MRTYAPLFTQYINNISIRFTFLRRFVRSEERFLPTYLLYYGSFLVYSLPKTVDDTALV